jgi:release factor glutamine methyltransferase
MATIQATLKAANSALKNVSDTAILDAELLLSFAIGKNRTFLRTWPEQALTPLQNQHFQSLLTQRKQGQPIAYLIGYREFWSREFLVTPSVLIPRPETELLVELVLAKTPLNKPYRILDLGTGSGAIAITLAAECPSSTITATDISIDALDIARRNAERLQVDNIEFKQCHWLQKLSHSHYDLIVSNPPYIAPDDPHLNQGDVRFEPDKALISEQQGLQDITLIADHARQYIKPGGSLYMEHGYDQQQAVQAILQHFDYCQIQTHNDLSGHPRVTSAYCQH